jgi:hypothetical protein
MIPTANYLMFCDLTKCFTEAAVRFDGSKSTEMQVSFYSLTSTANHFSGHMILRKKADNLFCKERFND